MTRILILTLAALAASAESPAADPAARAVQSFYTAYARHKFDGLPDKARLARVQPYLSSNLMAAMRTAQARQAACLKRHPDEKGPWVEGDLFSSNFEGFTAFAVAAPVAVDASRREVVVEFRYSENGQTVSWKDKAVVVWENGRWAVDDVMYRSQVGFSSGFGAALKQSLLSDPGCR